MVYKLVSNALFILNVCWIQTKRYSIRNLSEMSFPVKIDSVYSRRQCGMCSRWGYTTVRWTEKGTSPKHPLPNPGPKTKTNLFMAGITIQYKDDHKHDVTFSADLHWPISDDVRLTANNDMSGITEWRQSTSLPRTTCSLEPRWWARFKAASRRTNSFAV